MSNTIQNLNNVILARKDMSNEDSYTGYLFREGVDKILKKVGEESSEVIIAAKSLQAAELNGATSDDLIALKNDLASEVCDLAYHLLVLLADRAVPIDDVKKILDERAAKAGNLKQFRKTDKNT